MSKPCANCPFKRKGGVRGLSPSRVREIVKGVLKDEHFSCHKHVHENAKNPVCRGSLDFVHKILGDRVFAIGHLRMAKSRGWWVPSNGSEIFNDMKEMIEAQQIKEKASK